MVNGHLPKPFIEALQLLLSPIGAWLNAHDLASKGDWLIANSYYHFQGPMPITASMLESAEEFSTRHQEYDQLIEEFIGLQNGQEQNSVLDLWDSI